MTTPNPGVPQKLMRTTTMSLESVLGDIVMPLVLVKGLFRLLRPLLPQNLASAV